MAEHEIVIRYKELDELPDLDTIRHCIYENKLVLAYRIENNLYYLRDPYTKKHIACATQDELRVAKEINIEKPKLIIDPTPVNFKYDSIGTMYEHRGDAIISCTYDDENEFMMAVRPYGGGSVRVSKDQVKYASYENHPTQN